MGDVPEVLVSISHVRPRIGREGTLVQVSWSKPPSAGVIELLLLHKSTATGGLRVATEIALLFPLFCCALVTRKHSRLYITLVNAYWRPFELGLPRRTLATDQDAPPP